MALLSDDEVGISGAPVEPKASSSPVAIKPSAAPRLVSDDQVGFVDEAGIAKAHRDEAISTTMGHLKNMGGTTAVLADMVLSLPGFALSVGAQYGGTLQAMGRGETAKNAFAAGREAGEHYAAPFMNPLQRLMSALGNEKTYSDSSGGKAMEKLASFIDDAGAWVERSTGGRIPSTAMPTFADTVMLSLTGVGSGKAKSFADPSTVKRMRENLATLQKDAQVAAADRQTQAAREQLRAEEHKIATAKTSQQINDMLGIRTPEEQAKWVRDRRKQAKQGFNQPAEGSDYTSTENSVFKAEERIGQSQAMEVLQKAPEERTAQDLATIRLLVEADKAQKVREEGKAREAVDEMAGEPVSMEEAMRISQKEQSERTGLERSC